MTNINMNGAVEAREIKKEFFVNESGHGIVGSLKSLFKKRTVKAVDGVSFSIEKGEFVGYVGKNGAGKSTTIKILTGILVPTSGEVTVNGVVPYENRKKNAARIGVVFGQRTQLWWDLPVRDSFAMLKAIYRIKNGDFTEILKKLSDVLELGPLMDVPVRKLSLGQRMKCDIAASLLHRPGVLFLDEPTIGLDVVAKENIREFLREMNREEGTTIILTTHDMNDIEQLCKKLMILDRGRVVYDGLTEELKRKFVNEKLIEVEFDGAAPDISGMPQLFLIEKKESTLRLRYNGDAVGKVIGTLAAKFPVKDLSVRDPSVESIIRAIYENRLLLTRHGQ